MPMVALGAGGPVVSRIGLGLAALGRPAYITGGREDDLPDRSAAGLRARTFSVLDAAYAAGVSYVDAARSYGRAEEFLGGWLAGRGYPDVIIGVTTSGPGQAETVRRVLELTVDGRQLVTSAQVTWNLLEPSVGPAAAEAAAAGWAVLVKEAVANGRLTPAGGPPAHVTALAAARGVTEDAIALAAALAQPWASVVLSGAVTRAQLDANLAALTVGQLPALDLAESPRAYLAARAARPWH